MDRNSFQLICLSIFHETVHAWNTLTCMSVCAQTIHSIIQIHSSRPTWPKKYSYIMSIHLDTYTYICVDVHWHACTAGRTVGDKIERDKDSSVSFYRKQPSRLSASPQGEQQTSWCFVLCVFPLLAATTPNKNHLYSDNGTSVSPNTAADCTWAKCLAC